MPEHQPQLEAYRDRHIAHSKLATLRVTANDIFSAENSGVFDGYKFKGNGSNVAINGDSGIDHRTATL